MSSRRMSLLPQATLISDSEQFIYNWMLEDDLDLDEETGRRQTDERKSGQSRGKDSMQLL